MTPKCLEPYMVTFRAFLKSSEEKRIKELQAANRSKKADVMDF